MENFVIANLKEENDGQLNFFEKDIETKPEFMKFVNEQIKLFQSKMNYIAKYENININLISEFYQLIINFFEHFNRLSMQDKMLIKEVDASLYHKLCRFFLECLDKFIFSINTFKNLEDKYMILLEDFILMDQINFKDNYYNSIKEKIKNRKKLRVDNYIVFKGEALINELNYIFKEIDESHLKELNTIVCDAEFTQVFDKFNEKALDEDKKGIFSLLLLYYIGNNYQNINEELIEKIEQFIIYNFPQNISLTESQKKYMSCVKEDVGKKLSDFILDGYSRIKKHLRDFDSLENFKKTGKYKLIEESDNIDELPDIITKEDLEKELIYFINEIFMLDKDLSYDNLPIFQEHLEMERHLAMELSLEYLTRFIYKNPYYEDEKIATLEEYIYKERKLAINDSKLCLTKSKLMSRVSKRYVELSLKK